MEVPSARPHSPNTVEHVAPVGASEGGIVLLVVGSLHGEHTLLAVLMFGQEDVAVVFKIAEVGRVLHHVGVFNHLLHILLVDVVVAVGCLVAVAVGKRQIALGEICRSSNAVDAVLLLLHLGQHVVRLLEVVYYLAEQLLVCKLVVAGLLLKIVLHYVLVNPRHLAEHGDELEVEVGAQELNLCHTLLRLLLAKTAVAILLKREQRAVAAANSTVEAIPKFVELARCRSHGRPNLHRMIASVGSARSALQAVV